MKEKGKKGTTKSASHKGTKEKGKKGNHEVSKPQRRTKGKGKKLKGRNSLKLFFKLTKLRGSKTKTAETRKRSILIKTLIRVIRD